MIDAIYNKDVLRLAADITGIEKIKNPDATVSLRSPLCGSSIEISIIVIDDCITEYSQKIKACALGQASASVVAKAVIGKTREEILTNLDQDINLENWTISDDLNNLSKWHFNISSTNSLSMLGAFLLRRILRDKHDRRMKTFKANLVLFAGTWSMPLAVANRADCMLACLPSRPHM